MTQQQLERWVEDNLMGGPDYANRWVPWAARKIAASLETPAPVFVTYRCGECGAPLTPGKCSGNCERDE